MISACLRLGVHALPQIFNLKPGSVLYSPTHYHDSSASPVATRSAARARSAVSVNAITVCTPPGSRTATDRSPAASSGATAVVDAATAEIDAQLDALTGERDAARGELSESVCSRYDRVRSSSGVAVANLVGHRCDGCHLDLSAAEVDDVKDDAAAADGVADCPQCGRMLVV